MVSLHHGGKRINKIQVAAKFSDLRDPIRDWMSLLVQECIRMLPFLQGRRARGTTLFVCLRKEIFMKSSENVLTIYLPACLSLYVCLSMACICREAILDPRENLLVEQFGCCLRRCSFSCLITKIYLPQVSEMFLEHLQ